MVPFIVETALSFKQFLGREIAVTDWFMVTQDRIARFAEATEDRQWIHVDRERAKTESPYGAPVAHGLLTLSLVSHFLEQSVHVRSGVKMVINYGFNRVRFPSPVRVDAQMRARMGVQSVKELSDATEVIFAVTIEGQHNEKPHCAAEWIIRYYR